MDPTAGKAFRDSFCFATEDIAEGLSEGRDASADGYWAKWANFCQQVALDPLLVGYKDPVSILNTFAQDYRTEDIAQTSSPVQSRPVKDVVWPIGQALVALGLADPRYGNDRKIDICLRFQLRCYTKQEFPPTV